MKLDGDKLIAKIELREKTLLKYMDIAIENKDYEGVSRRWQVIQNARQLMDMIKTGEFTID